MRRKNSPPGARRTFVHSLKQDFHRVKLRRGDSGGDRNSMKKCMEELFPETAFEATGSGTVKKHGLGDGAKN